MSFISANKYEIELKNKEGNKATATSTEVLGRH